MVRSILGTWRRCGLEENVSYVQGPAQPLVIIHNPHVSTTSLTKGWGGLEGRIGLLALQPVPCLSGSCVGREGHGRLVCIKYTWSIGNSATWCNIPAPLSCRSLVAFKGLYIQFGSIIRKRAVNRCFSIVSRLGV